MIRTVTRRELLQARKLSRVLSIIVVFLAVASLGIYFLFAEGQALSFPAELAYIVASALFSAGLVSLLLSQVTLEESRLGLQATIESSIEASLLPLREVLQVGCQVDYRWHCLLSMPYAGDTYPDYSYQQITIEKDISELPRELRFVCVASMADDALSAFVDDPRYQFRWIVDENLEPNNRLLFDVLRVSVDGRDLPGRDVGLKLKYSSRQVCYKVPRGDGGSRRHTISFDVLVRKHFGSDRRVLIRTQLFQTTFGADFRCTISESVPMSKAWVSTSEVTGFGPMQPVAGSGRLVQGLPCSLHVRYDAPLQPGSTVAFHLERPDPV